MATAIMAAMFAATVLYENDFSMRRSEDAPPCSVWATYEYDRGGPVAYDFDRTDSFNRYTGMYPWGDKSSTYSQQDGWIKKDWGTGSRYSNVGRTSITDEDDPAVIYSAKDNSQKTAMEQGAIILHPLRNVFTNGVIRAQFDIRQPDSPANAQKMSWFRLLSEYSMKSDNTNGDQFPLEVGLSAGSLSGAWRDSGHADGTRDYHTFGAVQALHWYRYVITCDLDAMKSGFEVYDLGLSRMPMDAAPSGAAMASRADLLFRKELTASTGGISGIALRFSYTDTDGYYGEEGFNEDAAYKYDNIKVSWKAPGAASFEDCYRNDFAQSMRRTIDGSGELVHAYVQTEGDETSTFTYGNELVHKAGDFTWKGKPFLPATFGTANTVQNPGVDGWRFAGRQGFTGPVTLTTNGANRVCFISSSCQNLQPMCEDITNGLVKMEMDMRMPRGWNINGTSGYTALFLTSNRGYDEENEFNSYTLVNLGLSSTTGAGNSTTPVESYSVVNSSETNLRASYNTAWAGKFKALEWYRLQLFIDMDKTNYWFHVYDLGASAPATPDAFDSGNTANALVSGATNRLYAAAITRFGLGIGAYGVLNWNEPKKNGSFNGDYAMYFDNVRLWKGDGSGGWNLVFKNDFSTTVRNFRRKSVKLLKSSYIDRPEYGEDGWASTPTYNVSPRIVGENAALYSGDDYVSIVHPIGRVVKNGLLQVQYDVRMPVFWPSSLSYFRFQLGGGALASASTWRVNAYRAGSHRTIRAEFQANATADSTTGVKNQTDIVVQDGTGAGGDGTANRQAIGNSRIGHWIRMKIAADMSRKTWSCSAYDMGVAQPALNTADGTLLKSWSGLHFNFNDPISHLYFMTGKTTSFAPWRSDAPGALLVDNISVRHTPSGTLISFR